MVHDMMWTIWYGYGGGIALKLILGANSIPPGHRSWYFGSQWLFINRIDDSRCGSNKLDKLVLTGNTCSKLSSSYTKTQATFKPLQGLIEFFILYIIL